MMSEKVEHTIKRAYPEISVVIPVKNEAKSLNSLISEICQNLRGVKSFEVLLVDDGSEDETSDVLKGLLGQFSELRAFCHDRCYGQSAAILTGVKMAKGKVIATIDGDGQNDPADITRLLSLYFDSAKQNPVIIVGHRKERKDNFLKRSSSLVANRIRKFFLADDTPDSGCGLKVFSKEDFLNLPSFNHMHRFLPALILRDGGTVKSVVVNHRPRVHGISNYDTIRRLFFGIVDLMGVIWLRKRHVRSKAVSLRDPPK